MKIRRIFWIVFAIITSFTGLSFLPNVRPLSKSIHIQPGNQVEARFFVLFPGKYTLVLVFERTKPKDFEQLKQALGEFGCRKIDTGIPCGTFESYDFSWVIESSDQTIDGSATPKSSSGGWVSRSDWALGLSCVDLSFGIHKLRFEPHFGLSSLNNLSPKLVLRPGHGAKSLQSDPALLLSIAGVFCFYGLLPLFLTVAYVIYIFKPPSKTGSKIKSNS